MKRIPVNNLAIGNKIVKLDANWISSIHPDKAIIVKDKDTIKKLQKNGIKYVYIKEDIEENIAKEGLQNRYNMEILTEQDKSTSHIYVKNIHNNPKLYEYSIIMIKYVMNKIQEGKPLNKRIINDITDKILDITMENNRVLMNIAKLRRYVEYFYHHSLNASIYAVSLGTHYKLPMSELKTLAFSGLMLDIGKLFLPSQLIEKQGKLTMQEYEIVKKHSLLGYNYLKKQGYKENELKLVIEHHERSDGSGYPRGLKEKDISFHGKIGAVIDIFDAITSDRYYKEAASPNAALKEMFKMSGRVISKDVFEHFVSHVGIYPVGSLVMLNTKEIGLVYELNKKPIEPNIIVFFRGDGKKIPPLQINLSKKSFVKRKIIQALNSPMNKIPINIIAMVEKMYEKV